MKPKDSKGMRIFNKILLGLFSLMFGVAAGLPKLFMTEAMVENMALMGYPAWATALIGAIWVVLAVAIWFKKARLCVLLISSWILAGATAAHIAIIGTVPFPPPIFAFYALVAVLMYTNGFCDKLCDK